ncbi:MAG: hypothetical protein R6V15_12435 [Desulfotignum sp.]
MKITDPQVIKNGENDLIASVQENLDQKIVKKIIADRMAQTELLSKGGQIVVHDNQVAFRMDFDLQLSGSLLFDRQGNYIPDGTGLQTPGDKDVEDDTASPETPDPEFFQPEPDEDEDLARAELDQELHASSPSSSLTALDDELGNLDDEEPENTDLSHDDLDDDSLEFAGDLDLEEENDDDDDDQEDMLDEDINDILKESREFWEEKKDA